MEIGTPACSISVRVVCRESCSVIRGEPLGGIDTFTGHPRIAELCRVLARTEATGCQAIPSTLAGRPGISSRCGRPPRAETVYIWRGGARPATNALVRPAGGRATTAKPELSTGGAVTGPTTRRALLPLTLTVQVACLCSQLAGTGEGASDGQAPGRSPGQRPHPEPGENAAQPRPGGPDDER